MKCRPLRGKKRDVPSHDVKRGERKKRVGSTSRWDAAQEKTGRDCFSRAQGGGSFSWGKKEAPVPHTGRSLGSGYYLKRGRGQPDSKKRKRGINPGDQKKNVVSGGEKKRGGRRHPIFPRGIAKELGSFPASLSA